MLELGWFIARQPNGRYARYSHEAQTFTLCNLTKEKALELCCAYKGVTKEMAQELVDNATRMMWDYALEQIGKLRNWESKEMFAETGNGFIPDLPTVKPKDGGDFRMPGQRVAVYAGTFDPLTKGHMEMIRRGAHLFDGVVILVATNIRKQTMFTVEERVDLIYKALHPLHGSYPLNVEVGVFDSLLVQYMRHHGYKFILRGLRAVSDFDYEFQMALANKHLNKDIETVPLMASEEYLYVSSSMVKEIAVMGGDASQWVPQTVWKAIQAKVKK